MNQTTRRYASIKELPDFCTAEDLAQVLGVSKSTAYRMAANGSIPCLRIGKRVILSRDHLQKWLDEMLGSVGHA